METACRFLKAKGSDPPRLWVAGLAGKVEQSDPGGLVHRARAWFNTAVETLLSNPKTGDPDGDYFKAWLRECHNDVYKDIDLRDPREVCHRRWARSTTSDRR